MKKLLLVVLLACSGFASAAVTCNTYGNQTTCHGYEDGESVYINRTQQGNSTFTTGRIGDNNINRTCNTYGNSTTCY